jgi:hypothetical protein
MLRRRSILGHIRRKKACRRGRVDREIERLCTGRLSCVMRERRNGNVVYRVVSKVRENVAKVSEEQLGGVFDLNFFVSATAGWS